jgi:hypothetical protein
MNFEIRGIDPHHQFVIEDYITGDNLVLFNWLKTTRLIGSFEITVIIQPNDVFGYPFAVKVRNNKAQDYVFVPRFTRLEQNHTSREVHYGRDQIGQFMFDLEKQIQEVE